MPLVNGDNKQNIIAFALIAAASAGGGMVYRVATPPAQVGLSQETISQLTDRRKLELDALEHRLTFRIQTMEAGIRRDMPPEPIRRRLRALELRVQQMDPGWSPPTTDYSDF